MEGSVIVTRIGDPGGVSGTLPVGSVHAITTDKTYLMVPVIALLAVTEGEAAK